MVGPSYSRALWKVLVDKMTIEMAVDLVRSLFLEVLMLVSPLLLTSVAVGVSISIVQTVTSIQDQTLTFVPKIFAVGMTILVTAPWMVNMISEFASEMLQRAGGMAP